MIHIYMSWASKRQATYLSIVLFICGLIIFAILYPIISAKPTCVDGKKNAGELGVDCGGVCMRLCSSQVSEPLVLWSRAFPVVPHTYNLVAFIENQNKGGGVEQASYEFRVYDTNNKLIGRRTGTTFIPPNQQFAILEPRFETGQSDVRSVSFGFTGSPVWMKKAPTLQTLPIRVGAGLVGDDSGSPTFTTQLSNQSIYDMPAFDAVVILYDADHNAIQASKTHKEGLVSNATTSLFFTWPEPLSSQPVTWDVFPMINPFSVSF